MTDDENTYNEAKAGEEESQVGLLMEDILATLDGTLIHSLVPTYQDTPRVLARRAVVDARLIEVQGQMAPGQGVNLPFIRNECLLRYIIARTGAAVDAPADAAAEFWMEDAELFYMDVLMDRLDLIEEQARNAKEAAEKAERMAKLSGVGPGGRPQMNPAQLAALRSLQK